MASGNSPLLRHYDKLTALICIALAGAICFMWLTTKGAQESDKEAFADKIQRLDSEKTTLDESTLKDQLKLYSNAYTRITHPYKIREIKELSIGFFVPEKRAWCAASNCQAPIPPDSKECPKCGTVQPTKKDASTDHSLDSDGDGMPDYWEIKYKLNPYDAADAVLDSDGDGFSNLDEFKENTDPLNAKSHVDRMSLLRVRSIEVTKLPLILEGVTPVAEGKFKCQFGYYEAESKQKKMITASYGEELKWRKDGVKAEYVSTGFMLVRVDTRKEMVYSKVLKKEREEDVRIAVVKRISSGREIELRIGAEATDTDYIVTLIQTHNGEEYVAEGSEGEAEFTIDGKVYKLKKIDKSEKSVVIVSSSDKKNLTISAED